ncbi:MAG: histidinol dehydrogenase [Cyclobacteriaceae bacterium]|nr:histidinol dehydrogenase [Cyclobacteriaceae bacterium]
MRVVTNPSPTQWTELTRRPTDDSGAITASVREILNQVQRLGDAAVREYSRRFDRWQGEDFLVSEPELREAESQLPPSLTQAMLLAADNIRRFHQARISGEVTVETMPGVTCWTKRIPLQRVGIYVPGGSAPLFSTVLMLGLPAALAGCREVVLCSPPSADGTIDPAILFAARICGIRKVFRVGGAQAIAAMAYGTESIPAVDKIVGPGNQYVTKAKQLVSSEGVAIDFPAGPSEVLVVADETADPAFVAADLLSQAEHGPDSQVILAALDPTLADKVLAELNKQLPALPRQEIARQALTHGWIISFPSESQAMAFVNAYAPEHLIINTQNPVTLAEAVLHAGSVFLGPYSPEAAGDYASGTNHTLPTGGYARLYGGISCDSFMKEITFQQLSLEGLQNLGPAVAEMAAAEKLEGHRKAITIRLQS